MIEAESQTSASGEGITMSTLAEKLRQRKAATQSSPVVATPPEVATPAVVPEVVEPVVIPEPVVVASIIPPDAPGGDKVPERSEGIMATLAKRRSSKAEVQPVAVAEPVLAPVVEPVVAPEVKVEYGEPGLVDLGQKVALGKNPCREIVVATRDLVEPVTTSAPAPTLSLFVDCYPERAPFENLHALEDEIAERTPSLLEHLRKSSPKDVPEGTVDLGEVLFGRGYSTLSASFALKPITGAWTVSTLGPASSKVLEVLLPKATLVVRGRR
jgi:hypothetical protein